VKELSLSDVQSLKSFGDINGLITALKYPKDAVVRQAAAESLKNIGDYRIIESINKIKEDAEKDSRNLKELVEKDDRPDFYSVYMEDESPGHAQYHQLLERKVGKQKEIEVKEEIALLASQVINVISSKLPNHLRSNDPIDSKIRLLVAVGRRMEAIRVGCKEVNFSVAEAKAYVDSVLSSMVNEHLAQGKRNEAINLVNHAKGMDHREAAEYIDGGIAGKND
jgi:hypothetical protein